MNAFTRHAFASAIAAAALVASSAGTASAQTIGTFPFRLQPFCNNALLTVTQEGTTYRLAGWDDNCGAGNERFPLTGTISPNNDGTLHITFTVIRPTGVAVSTSIRNFNLGSLSGAFTDSAGNTGTAVIGGAAGGSGARPAPTSTLLPNSVSTGTIVDGAVTGAKIVDGAVGLAKVNTAEVQVRVTGACTAGSFIRSIDAAGNVVCGSAPAAPAPTTLFEENAVVNSFSGCEDISTLNFGTVAAGTLTCTATVHSVFDHVNLTTSRLEFGIETSAASCSDTQAGIFEMPGAFPDVTGHDTSVTVNRTFAVPAGTLTAYLNAKALFIASANELSHNFNCTFTPQ